jgi:hypothetical protein
VRVNGLRRGGAGGCRAAVGRSGLGRGTRKKGTGYIAAWRRWRPDIDKKKKVSNYIKLTIVV